MNFRRHRLILASSTSVVFLLLAGCSGSASKDSPKESAVPTPTAQVSQDKAVEVQTENKPGKLEGELILVTAKVKAIDKKNRVVTLKYPDGKEDKIQCGPEVRNFAQIRIGDDVTAQFLESAELFVTDEDMPAEERTTEVARAPLGSKPGFAAVDAVEVKASVEAIDYQTREVMLKTPEGKILTIKAGPGVKRLNEVNKGDTVVARLVHAVSIEVSKPVK